MTFVSKNTFPNNFLFKKVCVSCILLARTWTTLNFLTIFLHPLGHLQVYSQGKGLCRHKTVFIFPSKDIWLPINYSNLMEILEGQDDLTRVESHHMLRELFISIKTSSRGWKFSSHRLTCMSHKGKKKFELIKCCYLINDVIFRFSPWSWNYLASLPDREGINCQHPKLYIRNNKIL